jgi:putative ABC transport system permease protein
VNLWAILKIAIRALTRNKMRSALTMLGIIIGVGAVIAMVSIGQGAQSMIQTQINSMGSNMLFVVPGNVRANGVSQGLGAAATLTEDDVVAIEREVPTVLAASPSLRASAQLVFGNQNWNVQLVGANEKFPKIRNWPTVNGAFYTAADVRGAERVIVLGHTVAEKLFGTADPVGESIRVRNLSFRVIGVLETKGSTFGQDQDDTAVVPFTTVQKKLQARGTNSVGQAMISAVSPDATTLVQQQVEDLLRQRHRIVEGEPDDFTVRNLADVAAAGVQLTTIMTLLLGSIAGISLIVGGIGIMNIMLVSVTERTREIGIRMAVGARPSYIRLQFLTESVVLSLAGGALGMIGGGGAAAAIAWYLKWPSLVSGLAVAIAFGFSTGIGIFFGYYPAHKAAALDPIEALRYE